jgi:hypothetical protein
VGEGRQLLSLAARVERLAASPRTKSRHIALRAVNSETVVAFPAGRESPSIAYRVERRPRGYAFLLARPSISGTTDWTLGGEASTQRGLFFAIASNAGQVFARMEMFLPWL